MQLKLALVLTLLGSAAAAQEEPTRVNLDTMLYHDSDHTNVISSQVAAAAAVDNDGGEVAATVVVDLVSSASVDVISEATPGFTEAREEVDLRASKRWGAWLPGGHYRYSHEPDYLSHGGGLTLERRLGSADTVLNLSFGLAHDIVGRHETDFANWSRILWTTDAEIGLTQTLDQRTVVRAVYTLKVQDGYLAKPYRQVPLFDDAGLAAAMSDGATLSLSNFDHYRLADRPPENVPTSRVRHALGLRGLRYLPSLNGSLRVDYRLYADDWGIWSHTLDAGLRFPLGAKWLAEVKERSYYQTAAWFWQREYRVSTDGVIPEWRTVDKELTSSFAQTVGGALEWKHGALSFHGDLSATYEQFYDYLFLNSRLALVLMLGGRYTP